MTVFYKFGIAALFLGLAHQAAAAPAPASRKIYRCILSSPADLVTTGVIMLGDRVDDVEHLGLRPPVFDIERDPEAFIYFIKAPKETRALLQISLDGKIISERSFGQLDFDRNDLYLSADVNGDGAIETELSCFLYGRFGN